MIPMLSARDGQQGADPRADRGVPPVCKAHRMYKTVKEKQKSSISHYSEITTLISSWSLSVHVGGDAVRTVSPNFRSEAYPNILQNFA